MLESKRLTMQGDWLCAAVARTNENAVDELYLTFQPMPAPMNVKGIKHLSMGSDGRRTAVEDIMVTMNSLVYV